MSATGPTVVLIPSVKTTEDHRSRIDPFPRNTVPVTGDALDDLCRVYSVYVSDGEYAGFLMGAVGAVVVKNGNAVYTWQHIGEPMSPKGYPSLSDATDALIEASPMPSDNA